MSFKFLTDWFNKTDEKKLDALFYTPAFFVIISLVFYSLILSALGPQLQFSNTMIYASLNIVYSGQNYTSLLRGAEELIKFQMRQVGLIYGLIGHLWMLGIITIVSSSIGRMMNSKSNLRLGLLIGTYMAFFVYSLFLAYIFYGLGTSMTMAYG